MKEGVGESHIGFDINETSPGHISQSIEDVGLKDSVGLFIHRQHQLRQSGKRFLRDQLHDIVILLLRDGFIQIEDVKVPTKISFSSQEGQGRLLFEDS